MNLYDELVWRGLIKDISSDELKEKLNNGGLTFYIGTDPTADSMHLGHLSSFLISKRLKKAGHNPILLIGGATGLIGDPRPTTERAMITKDEVSKNFDGLKKQAENFFGFEVVNNYDWAKDINFIDFLRDYGKYFNINYMLDKDIIRRRLESGITYTEFSYMIMQAMDFLHLYEEKGCTLQVAGSDQWGNITAGIDLIRKKTGKEVYGFTMPLVTTKDGKKFGKSEGNALWLDKNKTSSYEMYQYLINVEDEMVIDYLKIFTFLSKEEIESLEESNKKEPHLRLAHKKLAHEIITFLHGEDEYDRAIKISEALFSGNINSLSQDELKIGFKDVPHFEITEDTNILDLLINNSICSSKREAREFLSSGAISINEQKITDENFIVTREIAVENEIIVIRRGKKKNYIGMFN
ncbi:MAG: tyrosine--tRNA ligase [Bacilli bacterium]|nr:tyrosine--tRNA ligase [Bacilli bacterium]